MDEKYSAEKHGAAEKAYSPENSPPYTTPLTSPPPEPVQEEPAKEGGCKQS